MTIGLGHYLVVAAILFTLGIFGIFINRKNVIIILMSIELILLAVNINLVAFSTHLGDLVGQVYALFVLTVAAAETAIVTRLRLARLAAGRHLGGTSPGADARCLGRCENFLHSSELPGPRIHRSASAGVGRSQKAILRARTGRHF